MEMSWICTADVHKAHRNILATFSHKIAGNNSSITELGVDSARRGNAPTTVLLPATKPKNMVINENMRRTHFIHICVPLYTYEGENNLDFYGVLNISSESLNHQNNKNLCNAFSPLFLYKIKLRYANFTSSHLTLHYIKPIVEMTAICNPRINYIY
jgi:hypothetical protein